ncbi:SLC32A [Mytilus edulis]|uniref:SLC32A n=1 Tax=Mytilus edulis TaxID=6550 RepID=A0A8S3SBL6_MYTED|nr:SLC32A [Mytilus edulis]
MSNEQKSHHGLTIWTTAVFIIGEIAGGGVLALPKAVEDTEIKLFLYKKNAHHNFDFRHLVTFSINFTLFGASTVYLILASENIEDLMSDITKDISFCYWLLILGAILTPITCLGTPADFWPIGVGATMSTGIACILILIQVLHDNKSAPPVTHSSTDFMKFSAAFGTLVFSVSGHPAFPTFIADMKKKTDFKWAILIGYISEYFNMVSHLLVICLEKRYGEPYWKET